MGSRDGGAKKFTNKGRDDNNTRHIPTHFLETLLLEKDVGWTCIIIPTLVCKLFGTSIPTSHVIIVNCFYICTYCSMEHPNLLNIAKPEAKD